jgi:hypothetical protein
VPAVSGLPGSCTKHEKTRNILVLRVYPAVPSGDSASRETIMMWLFVNNIEPF